MVKSAALLYLLPLVTAWPAALDSDVNVVRVGKRSYFNPNVLDIKGSGVYMKRKNTGLAHPVVPFNAAEQYIDTVHKFPFQSPGPEDRRGECPGLNACANHGICPRSGIWTIAQTVQGLGDAYSMTSELAAGLAVISILLSGDPIAGTWSIGTGYQSSLPGILSDPKGLTGLHNKYEGDASIGRWDAYLADGNVGDFHFPSWEAIYDVINEDVAEDPNSGKGNFSPYKSAQQNTYTREFSKQNNPYYFSGEFSGLVTSAVRGFVYGFMSNHSAENPEGYLNQDIINTFFAVTGEPGSFEVHYGQERIPDNWFKRPFGDEEQYGHSLADVFIELAASAAEFPGSLELGGNTGTVNSFQGIEPSSLFQGLADGAALTDPNKLACMAYFLAEQADVDFADKGLETLNSAVTALVGQLSGAFAQFSCPELHQYNSNLYNVFPGYKYTGDSSSNSGNSSQQVPYSGTVAKEGTPDN